MEGGQHGRGGQGHGPAAEDHQPQEHEVQEEELRHWPQVGQPVDGHPIDDDIGTVLWQLAEDLQSTAFAGTRSRHRCWLSSEDVLKRMPALLLGEGWQGRPLSLTSHQAATAGAFQSCAPWRYTQLDATLPAQT